jgi:tetratricopeptide (TPR) repeat protein
VRRLRVVLAAGLIASPAPAAAQDATDPRQSLEAALRSAEARLQAGELEAARQAYRAALPRGFLLLASLERLDGREAPARAALRHAEELAQGDPELLFLLATEYLWLKDVDAADRYFAEVVGARPIPQTRVLIGRAFRDAGEHGRARQHLRAALAQDPAVRRAHYYLGMVALADEKATDRLRQAEAEFREELKLSPHDPLANDQLGLALLDAIRPAEALPFLETAVRAEPRSLFLFHLGRCLLALDRPEEARDSLQRSLARAGEERAGEAEREVIHYHLGQALRRLGQRENAARELAEAARLAARRREAAGRSAGSAPGASAGPATGGLTPEQRGELTPWVTQELARACFNLGVLEAQGEGDDVERFARAARELERTAALDPDFPELQRSLGVAYFSARRFEYALGPLERALSARPGDADLRRMLATASVNAGAWQKAAALLQDDAVRERDPGLQFAYGLSLLRGGSAERAEPALRRAVELDPSAAEPQAVLAEALASLGRAAEAVAPLENAVRLDPENARVHEQLGQLYRALGRFDDAAREFERSRELLARGGARP